MRKKLQVHDPKLKQINHDRKTDEDLVEKSCDVVLCFGEQRQKKKTALRARQRTRPRVGIRRGAEALAARRWNILGGGGGGCPEIVVRETECSMWESNIGRRWSWSELELSCREIVLK